MDKLTKEQIGMFTAIAAILMLVAYFFVDAMMQPAVKYLSRGAGWFGIICLIIAMLAPIYTVLFAFRDQKVLEPLKPIFVLSPGMAYALPLIALGLCLFAAFFDGGWGIILYAVGAVAAFKIGQSDK